MARQKVAKLAVVREEVERVSTLLRRKIRGAGLTYGMVEERLGWGQGYLSQVLNGKVHLKLEHFFAVAKALGLSPQKLFAELAAPPAGTSAAPGTAAAPARAVRGRSPSAKGPVPLVLADPKWEGTADELRSFIVTTVREMFFGKGRRW
jgi:transcriptional regulator with XRE-family HTH domain